MKVLVEDWYDPEDPEERHILQSESATQVRSRVWTNLKFLLIVCRLSIENSDTGWNCVIIKNSTKNFHWCNEKSIAY